MLGLLVLDFNQPILTCKRVFQDIFQINLGESLPKVFLDDWRNLIMIQNRKLITENGSKIYIKRFYIQYAKMMIGLQKTGMKLLMNETYVNMETLFTEPCILTKAMEKK